ncbi:hypothetical protein LJC34_06800 [Oscillospiraceae bacterium OttesenSCG-928-G22]|nr:hypothetical protein [Oscillospiraceae bacterium OttesenSCG-928-G22]
MKEYGAIPQGEKASRDVSVPRKTGENEYVRRFVRTAMEAGATPDEMIPSFEKSITDGTFITKLMRIASPPCLSTFWVAVLRIAVQLEMPTHKKKKSFLGKIFLHHLRCCARIKRIWAYQREHRALS